MKRGTSAPSRLGLFYSNHFDLARCTHPQATFIWTTTDCHRCFFIGQSGLLISVPPSPALTLHSSSCHSELQAVALVDEKAQIYGSLTFRVTVRISQRCRLCMKMP